MRRKVTAYFFKFALKALYVLDRDARRNEADAGLTERIRAWVMDGRHCEGMSLSEAAKELGVSKQKLVSYFRRVVGVPFLTWRIKLRIAEAKGLIKSDPDLPLYVVGEMVGIPDRSNFRRHFREIVGMTPHEFREFTLGADR